MSHFTRNPAEFYAFAVHILFTLLLTSSFGIAQDVFIPLGDVKTLLQQINTFALFFIYFVVISGWIGYTRSISKRPHRNSKWGTLRFLIDVLIIMVTFYLTGLTDPEIFEIHFSEAFIWVLPAIFALYSFWDLVRLREYMQCDDCYKDQDEKNTERQILKERFYTSISFLLLCISQLLVFLYIINTTISSQWTIIDVYRVFIITSSVIFAVYRYSKWNFRSLRIYHIGT